MELAINNLIKMSIGVLVIVLVIGGIFIGMKSYVIPYFSGIGFEEPKVDINTQFGGELIQDKNLIGRVDKDGFFMYENKKTDLRFKDNKILLFESFLGIGWLNPDTKAGTIEQDGKLVVEPITEYYEILNGAYKYGNEIYKIGGDDDEE